MTAPHHPNLLQEILDPLVEDFEYWFERSAVLLGNNRITFLKEADQAELLSRVEHAQAELQSAKQLYNLTSNTVGIDSSLVMKWHRLLVECGSVGSRFRRLNEGKGG